MGRWPRQSKSRGRCSLHCELNRNMTLDGVIPAIESCGTTKLSDRPVHVQLTGRMCQEIGSKQRDDGRVGKLQKLETWTATKMCGFPLCLTRNACRESIFSVSHSMTSIRLTNHHRRCPRHHPHDGSDDSWWSSLFVSSKNGTL